jgi:hypothetical protein
MWASRKVTRTSLTRLLNSFQKPTAPAVNLRVERCRYHALTLREELTLSKDGDTADDRMTERNELITSAKAFDRARSAERLHHTTFGSRGPRRLPPFVKTAS